MAERMISRTIFKNTIHIVSVRSDEEGKVHTEACEDRVVYDTAPLSMNRAKREVNKGNSKEDATLYMVAKVDTEATVFGMELDRFLEYASPIERPLSQR